MTYESEDSEVLRYLRSDGNWNMVDYVRRYVVSTLTILTSGMIRCTSSYLIMMIYFRLRQTLLILAVCYAVLCHISDMSSFITYCFHIPVFLVHVFLIACFGFLPEQISQQQHTAHSTLQSAAFGLDIRFPLGLYYFVVYSWSQKGLRRL